MEKKHATEVEKKPWGKCLWRDDKVTEQLRKWQKPKHLKDYSETSLKEAEDLSNTIDTCMLLAVYC